MIIKADATVKSCNYELIGIVNHIGTLNKGHYTAYNIKVLVNARIKETGSTSMIALSLKLIKIRSKYMKMKEAGLPIFYFTKKNDSIIIYFLL